MVNANSASTSSTRLLEWCLSAFHTSLFFWLFVVVLYLTGNLGNLLASLNTMVGVIIFLYLWVTTWLCTSQVVRRTVNSVDWGAKKIPLGKALVFAMLAGGVNGLLLFYVSLFLAAVVAVMAVASGVGSAGIPTVVVFFGYTLAVGSVLSFGIGAIFGLLFALLDLLLLGGSQVLFALNARPTSIV